MEGTRQQFLRRLLLESVTYMLKSFNVFFSVLFMLLVCMGCSNSDGLILAPKEVANTTTMSPVVTDKSIQSQSPSSSPVAVLTAKPVSTSITDTMQVLVGQKALDSAVANILNAKKSIDMDMYEFTNSKIIAALEKAEKNGVKERIVLDVSSTKAADELKNHGINVHIETVPGAINHVKFLQVDDSKVLLGSVNFGSGSGKNEDAVYGYL